MQVNTTHIEVFRAGQTSCSFPLDDKTIYREQLMTLKEITCSVISPAPLPIAINDYILFGGEEFAIEEQWGVTEKDGLFFYTILFEHEIGKLRRKKIKDEKGRKTFSYYGDAQNYLQLIIDNINQIVPGFSIGKVDLGGEQHIEFDGDDCRSALFKIAEAFKLEFYAEGKKIHLVKQVGKDLDVSFEQGMGNGVYELQLQTLDNTGIVTRLYGYGGKTNIAPSYRDNIGQLVFGARYIDRNTDIYGIREDDFINETIYPKRTGTVTATSSLLSFTDDTINFDLNDCFLEGEQAMITLNTGDLTGESLNIRRYDHTTKTVYLEEKKDGDYALPSNTRKLQIGNEYVFTGIKMPNSYNDDAETDLYIATDAASAEYSIPRVSYALSIDEKFIRDNGISLKIGDRPFVKSTKLGINNRLRTTAIEFPLVNPDDIKATVGNVVVYQPIDRIAIESKKNERAIRQVSNQVSAVKPVVGAYLSFRGDYDSTTDYYGGKDRVEVIKYNDEFYHTKINAGTFKGYTPTNTLKWTKFDGQFESLATGLLLAELAYIENLGVRFLATDEAGKKRFVIDGNQNNARQINSENKIINLIDDDSAYEGNYLSKTPPLNLPNGNPDPNYLGLIIRQENGADVTYYRYAKRGPGITAGTPGNATASLGRHGFTGADSGNTIRNRILIDETTGKGLVRLDVGQALIFDQLLNKATGLTQSVQLKLATLADGTRIVTWDEVQQEALEMYNPNVVADAGDDGNGGGGVIIEPEPEDPELPITPTSLRQKFDFSVGSAIKKQVWDITTRQIYKDIAISQFDRWSPENEMKMGRIVKVDGNGNLYYDWTDPDWFMDLCKANGKKAMIHCVIWANEIKDDVYAVLEAMTLQQRADWLTGYVTAYFERYVANPTYAGVAEMIDLINEPFDTAGNLKASRWKTLLPNFHIVVLTAAQPYKDKIKIGINDFDIEYGNNKASGIVTFRDAMAMLGLTFHYIGSQMHSVVRMAVPAFRQRLKILSDAGIMVHISELDVKLRQGFDDDPDTLLWPTTTTDLFNQRTDLQNYHKQFFLDVFQGYIECVHPSMRLGISTWSIGFRENAMNSDGTFSDFPVLWDYAYNPTPAYNALLTTNFAPYPIELPL